MSNMQTEKKYYLDAGFYLLPVESSKMNAFGLSTTHPEVIKLIRDAPRFSNADSNADVYEWYCEDPFVSKPKLLSSGKYLRSDSCTNLGLSFGLFPFPFLYTFFFF
jgi:hypothetical protein